MLIFIFFAILIALFVYFLVVSIYLHCNDYVIVFYNEERNIFDLEDLEKPLIVKRKVLEQKKEKEVFLNEYLKINILSFFLFVYFKELHNAFYDYYNKHYIEY